MTDPLPHARVVVLDDFEGVSHEYGGWDRLSDRIDVTVHRESLSGDDLVAAVRDADILTIMRERTPIDAALLDRMSHLKLIATTGHRNPSLDVEHARSLGITVCDTRSAKSTTAELAWALIMGSARHLVENDSRVHRGEWAAIVGRSLGDHTLGLFGFGNIARRVAKVARAFDMETIAWSPSLDAATAAEHGVTAVSRDELFSLSDILSLHARLTPTSRDTIGAPELAHMKDDAILVNCARAGLIQEDALRETVEAGRLGALGFDVYWNEPVQGDEWFLQHPRILTMPHTGYVVDSMLRGFYEDVVEDVERFIAGDPIRVLPY